tara:strand:+ start:65 stop:511 length:447 start_codon:yes stop_codon:yes gene_type:complete
MCSNPPVQVVRLHHVRLVPGTCAVSRRAEQPQETRDSLLAEREKLMRLLLNEREEVKQLRAENETLRQRPCEQCADGQKDVQDVLDERTLLREENEELRAKMASARREVRMYAAYLCKHCGLHSKWGRSCTKCGRSSEVLTFAVDGDQ